MSETPKPEEAKKGWLSRWRSKGDPAPETPEPEAASETPEARRPRPNPKAKLRGRAGCHGCAPASRNPPSAFTESITGLFTKKKLDQQTLDELEDALIQATLASASPPAWSRSSARSVSARK